MKTILSLFKALIFVGPLFSWAQGPELQNRYGSYPGITSVDVWGARWVETVVRLDASGLSVKVKDQDDSQFQPICSIADIAAEPSDVSKLNLEPGSGPAFFCSYNDSKLYMVFSIEEKQALVLLRQLDGPGLVPFGLHYFNEPDKELSELIQKFRDGGLLAIPKPQ